MQALDINSGNCADVDIRSDRVFDQETLILELGKLFLNILWFNCDAAQFLLCGHLCGHLCVYVCVCVFAPPGDRDGFAFAAFFSYGAVVYVNCDQQVQIFLVLGERRGGGEFSIGGCNSLTSLFIRQLKQQFSHSLYRCKSKQLHWSKSI